MPLQNNRWAHVLFSFYLFVVYSSIFWLFLRQFSFVFLFLLMHFDSRRGGCALKQCAYASLVCFFLFLRKEREWEKTVPRNKIYLFLTTISRRRLQGIGTGFFFSPFLSYLFFRFFTWFMTVGCCRQDRELKKYRTFQSTALRICYRVPVSPVIVIFRWFL